MIIILIGMPPKAELDHAEVTFVKDFWYLMKVSHYQHLLDYEWDEAL